MTLILHMSRKDQMTLNENNSKPVPPDHNDKKKLIDTHLGDYPEKLAKKNFISFKGCSEYKSGSDMPIREFDNWLRTGVQYGCDGTVYRSKRVLNHQSSILGKENCDRNTKKNPHGKKLLRPVHDEHAFQVNLRSNILYNKNKREVLSFNEICEFIFLTQVIVCVTAKAALDQEGKCDNDSLSVLRKIGKNSAKISWDKTHPNVTHNFKSKKTFNDPLQVSFHDLDGNPISFCEIPVFSRYFGTDIEINRYNKEADEFKLLDIHNYKMADHFKYMRNMYPEALEKIRGLN